MIKERYVSFEIAKLLKEKGMDKNCFTHYMQQNNDDGTSEAVTTCTHQMAMEWLREKGIFIAINNDDLDYNWQCYDLINRESTKDPKILSSSYAGYKTYEAAVEAAILYSLENLI